VAAIQGARLERVVALSTYGAEPGERIGDLGTLHRFEQRLAALETPVAIVRAAYLLSNWDGLLPLAGDDGVLPTMLDPDLRLPMVDPADLGVAAADLLTRPAPATGTHFVEGPSAEAAESYAGMTTVTVDGDLELLESPTRGATTLRAYLDALVHRRVTSR
jgi:uncharacterized protein YbjT (DUF2867 family)